MHITYKNWAFRFVIWIVIINIASFYVTLNYINLFYDQARVGKGLFLLGLLANLLLVGTILFLILSIVKKEKRNYKFWIALGIAVLMIINVVIAVINQIL